MDRQTQRNVPPNTYLGQDSTLVELVHDARWRAVLVRDDLARARSGLTSDMLMIIDVLNLLARKVEDG